MYKHLRVKEIKNNIYYFLLAPTSWYNRFITEGVTYDCHLSLPVKIEN